MQSIYENDKIKLKIGSRIEITDGPLKELQGTVITAYKKDNRYKIKLDLYGEDFCINIGSGVLKCLDTYVNDVKQIALDNEIVVNQSILERINDYDDLFSISPYKFENLVGEILEKQGFDVKITQRSKDGGRDILSILKTPIGEMLTIVECKQYSRHRKIGIDIVERLLWICEHQDHASKAMIVTTSEFTRGCYNLKDIYKYKLELKDIGNVIDWISHYGKINIRRNSYIWSPKIGTN